MAVAKHYDVVILGAGIGALVTAALLSRRSWRVLLVGQETRPPTYSFGGHALSRRPFVFLAATSPAWGRVLAELAQTQTWKRRVVPADPMVQILGPGLRFEIARQNEIFQREVDREFPEIKRPLEELYERLSSSNALLDSAFRRDLVWPPGSFWERRETGRVLAALPLSAAPIGADVAPEIPPHHVYRSALEATARMATDRAGLLPPLALARLHGAWTRGLLRLAGGEDELVEFLTERIRAQGGEIALRERAIAVTHKAGRAEGVILDDGSDTVIGAAFIVTDLPTRALLDLTPHFHPSPKALASLPALVARERRYVVSMVVANEGLPAPLAADAFLLPDLPFAERLVHLSRVKGKSTSLLVAETVLEGDAARLLPRARESVVRSVQRYFPFVDRHVLLVDSPHDGRALWDFRSGRRVAVDRAMLLRSGGPASPEPMSARWEALGEEASGLGAEPLRTPLANAFIVGRTALPALGQEGELLAAWSVARLITKTDRKKEKMRREMWSKVDFG